MSDVIMDKLGEKVDKSLANLKENLNSVRAGRANPALLDKIMVDYYGSPTPLKQLANIAVSDPRTLTVTPFDPKSIGSVEHAIAAANIGINPVNDGKVVRLSIPQLTEERRKDLAKEAKKLGEEAKVAVRNLRRTANEDIKKLEKAGDYTEDDVKETEEEVKKAVEKAIKDIDEIVAKKDRDIMEV
ncbi:MAG: ribosome recycling factor [Eubacteriaceae bacterium]|jgi:ribosome recycling factor|nr:ribosome recycling factor [Eubacteriaceae bacterium]